MFLPFHFSWYQTRYKKRTTQQRQNNSNNTKQSGNRFYSPLDYLRQPRSLYYFCCKYNWMIKKMFFNSCLSIYTTRQSPNSIQYYNLQKKKINKIQRKQKLKKSQRRQHCRNNCDFFFCFFCKKQHLLQYLKILFSVAFFSSWYPSFPFHLLLMTLFFL